MEILRIDRLSAGYAGGPDVVRDVSLDVGEGEVVALLGASGSGKSTLLRCIAGLHAIRTGRITIDGRDMQGVGPENRGVGFVFQDHALFPHRDVAGNVAFGPRMQRLGPQETADRVQRALEDVGLAQLSARAVDELSGGEQQRVALARAIAAHPRLLLLDEPYGSLDRPLRERLASELPAIVQHGRLGAILVTHDQQEALRAADRIAVIVEGNVRQFAFPEVLWRDPADPAVAAFLGVGPLLAADVRDGSAHGSFGVLPLPDAPDGPAIVLVPHAGLRTDRRHGDAGLRGTILEVRFAGDHHRVSVLLRGGERATVRLPQGSPLPAHGASLELGVDPAALRRFPPLSVAAPARSGVPDQ